MKPDCQFDPNSHTYTIGSRRVPHDLRKSPTWNSWRGMKSRCLNPKDSRFSSYGGKGIAVCQRWKAFRGFLEDMGLRPEGTSLDRINLNGNYEPSNCRWASHREQRLNRNGLRLFSAFNETKSLVWWAEDRRCVVSFSYLRTRISRGWDIEAAIATPTRS